MHFHKPSGLYKASNLTFDPNPATLEAWSYGWWKFVTIVNNQVVFSNYKYSTATVGHQWKTKRLMYQLGIRIDLEMPVNNLKGRTFEEMIINAEENLCNSFLNEESKRIKRNEKARDRRRIAKFAGTFEFDFR